MVLDKLQQRPHQHWLRFQLKSALARGEAKGHWTQVYEMLREDKEAARLLVEDQELAQRYGPSVLGVAINAHPEVGLWLLKRPELRTLRVARQEITLAHEAVQHHLKPARYALEHPEIRQIEDDNGMTVAAHTMFHHAVIALEALEDPEIGGFWGRSTPRHRAPLSKMAPDALSPGRLIDEMEELGWPPDRRQEGLLILARESPGDFIVFVNEAPWLKDMPRDFFPPLLKAAPPKGRRILLRRLSRFADWSPDRSQTRKQETKPSPRNTR